MSNKFIFSGRARSILEEFYFIWIDEIENNFSFPLVSGDKEDLAQEAKRALAKGVVPDSYFIHLFSKISEIRSKNWDRKSELMLRLLDAIGLAGNYPKANVMGRAFPIKDKEQIFDSEYTPSAKFEKYAPSKNYVNFFCFLLTGMELDEFKDNGKVGILSFHEDVFAVGEKPKPSSAKKKNIRNSNLLTSIPSLDFDTEIVAREGDIGKIEEAFKAGKRKIQLHGVGGSGKSILALSYVHTHRNQWDHILWIEQGTNLIPSISTNFQLLNSLGIRLSGEEMLEEIFQLIMLKLEQKAGRNLLVIDDTDASILAPETSRYLPSSGNWHMLITARGPLEGFRLLEVDALVLSEALQLFRFHFKKSIYPQTEQDLLQSVEYHALAIELLAKTLMTNIRISPEELLQKIQELELDKLQAAPYVYMQGKEARLFSYLLTTFEVVREDFDDLSLQTLLNFSILIPSLIPVQDIIFLFGIDENSLNPFLDVLNRLNRGGWISVFKKSSSVQIHRMVRDMLYYQLNPGIEEIEPLIEELAILLSDMEEDKLPIEIYKWATFADHLTLLLRGEKNETLSMLYEAYFAIIGLMGEYEKAIEISNYQLGSLIQEHGLNSGKVSSLRANIAILNLQMGDYPSAIEQLDQAIITNTQVFGEDDIRVYENTVDLASAYNLSEQPDKGKKLLEELKPQLEKKLGIAHPLSRKLNLNLGEAYLSAGLEEEAKNLFEKILTQDLQNYPPEHHELSTVFSQLGTVYNRMRDWGKAREFFEKALNIDKKVFGDKHQAIASSYTDLGTVAYDSGDSDMAIAHFDSAIEIYNSLYDGMHPEMISTLNLKASILLNERKLKAAETLFRQAKKICIQFYPPNHETSIDCSRNIARLMHEKGQYQEAISLLEEILQLAQNSYVEARPLLATIHSTLAESYWEMGELYAAQKHLEHSLSIKLELLGKEHPDVLDTLKNLGQLLTDRGQYTTALEKLTEAYQIAVEEWGDSDYRIVDILLPYASCLEECGEFEKAQRIYQLGANILGKLVEEGSDIYLADLSNYALFLEKIGETEQAIQILRELVYELSDDDRNWIPTALLVQLNLAKSLKDHGKIAEAEIEFCKYLEKCLLVYGEEDRKSFNAHMLLIDFYQDENQIEKNLVLIPKLEAFLSSSNSQTFEIVDRIHAFTIIGFYYAEVERGKARFFLKRAYELAKEKLGEEDELTKECMANLNRLSEK